jgi:hypothetical protein
MIIKAIDSSCEGYESLNIASSEQAAVFLKVHINFLLGLHGLISY